MKRATAVLLLLSLVAVAFPQSIPALPKIGLSMGGGTAKGDEVATSLQILALLTVLSLAPALLMLTTCFTRIVIILGFVRTALGTPSLPPNQVLVGLSLFLTLFVMKPTWEKVDEAAIKPLTNHQIDIREAVKRATPPVRDFMLRSTYTSDLRLFIDLRGGPAPKTKEELDLTALVPAFIISELKTAFLIGFYVFIPFLIIDLIVSSALMGMGMMMMPPTVISLPAKILVFVLADGWGTLIQAILAGYR